MRQVINAVFVIIATLIGAGFASGQEINIFFYQYGKGGLIGIVICSILFSYIIYKVLKIAQNNNIHNYKEFILFLINNTAHKKYANSSTHQYLNTGFIFNIIINLFLVITFFIMVAGFGAYFEQEFSLNSYIGSFILIIFCILTIMTNISGIVKINSIIVPILIGAIILIGGINIYSLNIQSEIVNMQTIKGYGWLLSSILYCSYNSILLVPILIAICNFNQNKKSIITVSALSGAFIFILSIMIYFLITKAKIDVNNLEMPVVYVVRNYFSSFKFMYACVVLISIYTTSISTLISLLKNVTNNKKTCTLFAVCICFFSLAISGVGFTNLVTLLYPMFGVLGLIQIIYLLAK